MCSVNKGAETCLCSKCILARRERRCWTVGFDRHHETLCWFESTAPYWSSAFSCLVWKAQLLSFWNLHTNPASHFSVQTPQLTFSNFTHTWAAEKQKLPQKSGPSWGASPWEPALQPGVTTGLEGVIHSPNTLNTGCLLCWNAVVRSGLAAPLLSVWIHHTLTIMIPGKQTVNSSVRNHTTARAPVHTFQQAWQLMPLPQNGVENREEVVLILQTVPQFTAEVETHHQSRSVPQLKLLLSHYLLTCSWRPQTAHFPVLELGCSGKWCLHTIHAHSSEHTDPQQRMEGPGRVSTRWGNKPCNGHWDPSGTSPSQFPYLEGKIIFLLREHIHYRDGFQKRQWKL